MYFEELLAIPYVADILHVIGVILIETAPIWVTFLLGYIFWSLWMVYIRVDFIQKQGSLLLEFRIPKEIYKSPRAMELFLMTLYQTGGANRIETYWEGKIRPWFSLELVSLGGDVRFFVWTHPKYKKVIQTQLYAQYPTVEIYEVEDYTAGVTFDPKRFFIWGTYFKLAKPDPYPIMTYVDYGLDKDPKEELKIDPIANVIEYLGGLEPGEQAWIQILIQAHKKEDIDDGRLFKKADWKTDAKKEVMKIISESTKEAQKQQDGLLKNAGKDVMEFPPVAKLRKSEDDQIEAIERSIDKFAFDTMIRAFYIAEWDAFNSVNIPGLIGSVRQYSSNSTLNGFKLGWFTDVDYPWQDFRSMRVDSWKKHMLEAYKRRSFFHPPFKSWHAKPFILNTEELATIFHFPSGVVQTPSFKRILSKKVEAPSNLPQ